MKTFYRIDELSNQIVELTDDDIIDDICRMRTEGGKDNQFYNWVRDYLINTFWEWQCQYPMEVDPAFQIFDCIEDAQEKQRENQEVQKLNEEVKKEINLVERSRLKRSHDFIESIRSLEVEEEKHNQEIYESNFKDFIKD